MREGHNILRILPLLSVSVLRTIYDWLAKFAKGEPSALLAKPIPGCLPKINADQMRWIANAVKDNTPLHFNFNLWTLSLIQKLINRQFSQSLSLVPVSRIMKRLSFTAQKPLH